MNSLLLLNIRDIHNNDLGAFIFIFCFFFIIDTLLGLWSKANNSLNYRKSNKSCSTYVYIQYLQPYPLRFSFFYEKKGYFICISKCCTNESNYFNLYVIIQILKKYSACLFSQIKITALNYWQLLHSLYHGGVTSCR